MKKDNLGTHNRYYLARFRSTLTNALRTHPRTLAVRVDLRLPEGYCVDDNKAIEAFTPAIKSRLAALFKRKKKKNPGQQIHQSGLHYIWVRENNQSGEKIHYHALLMFNKDSFWTLGNYKKKGNLADLITQAWISALKLKGDEHSSLVSFPENPCYHLFRGNLRATTGFHEVMRRIDYMAKHRTKQYSNKIRTLGCSVSEQGVLEEEYALEAV